MEYDEETQQNHPRIKSEDHFSLTEQNGKYLTHLTHEKVAGPTSSSEQVADSIVNWMTAHGVDRTLVALGADSTASNTGHKGGSHPLHRTEDRAQVCLAGVRAAHKQAPAPPPHGEAR